jgi:hypothetical protein
MRLGRVAVQQRQVLRERVQWQQLAVQVTTRQYFEAKSPQQLITLAAVRVAARQAVALQQVQQHAQQTAQLTAVQAVAETARQVQTTLVQVAQEYC